MITIQDAEKMAADVKQIAADMKAEYEKQKVPVPTELMEQARCAWLWMALHQGLEGYEKRSAPPPSRPTGIVIPGPNGLPRIR